MKTETVRDIFHHTKAFHKMASEFYQSLVDKADKERTRMLLNYLSIHEKHLEETLSEYEDIANTFIMDYWIKYSSCDENFSRIKENINNPPDSVSELINLAIELDDCVIKMFKYLRDNSKTEELRIIFDNILQLEKQEERLAVRDMGMINEF